MNDLIDRFGADALAICRRLREDGHDAVVVGGPVRDALLDREAADVDLATSARPAEVRALFDRTFVQGKGERHGTVGVFAGPSSDEPLEVTTYRLDLEADGRHARVAFTDVLEKDLQRRDFTINAMAVRPGPDGAGELVDPFDGREDLEGRVLRAVGTPADRMEEDYLRVLRGYRFAARFDLDIEEATRTAMREAASGLDRVSRERVREELMKTLGQTPAGEGRLTRTLERMYEDGVLERILPEVTRCAGVEQNEYHAHDVMGHMIRAADAASPDDPLLRFVLLVHDVGKPATRSVGEDGRVHFYEHETVGADQVGRLARRLAFSADDRARAVEAVAQHMRLLGMRRGTTPKQLRRIGRDLKRVTLEDLLVIRVADKSASGVPEHELPRTAVAATAGQIAAIRADENAMKVTDLAVDGRDVMEVLDLDPGPRVGEVLDDLLERVIEDPDLNRREALLDLLERERSPEQPSPRTR